MPFSLLVITDVEACRARARGVIETVARALDRKLTDNDERAKVAVLLRDKRSPVGDVARTARALRAVTARAGTKLLIHTHVDVARDEGLDGAHLDARADVDAARAALGPELLLGASRHVGDILDRAHTDGLDYVTMSPVFAPTSKPDDPRAPLGVSGLARVVEKAALPVVALGGVTDLSVGAVLGEARASAVAVLGSVMGAPHPERALRALLLAEERA